MESVLSSVACLQTLCPVRVQGHCFPAEEGDGMAVRSLLDYSLRVVLLTISQGNEAGSKKEVS